MSTLRVHGFAISIDGYGAGPRQDLEHPLGENGFDLMGWFVHTRTWRQMQGEPGGESGIDERTGVTYASGAVSPPFGSTCKLA